LSIPGPSISVEEVPLEQLREDPTNARRTNWAELEALTRSLDAFGFVQPVGARREDRMIIAGHQRLVAARRAGRTTVPVIFLDIDLPRARALGLALNRIAGTWDEALLARLLAELL
jgi:ParB-like chromosome segregation protein Spo0J